MANVILDYSIRVRGEREAADALHDVAGSGRDLKNELDNAEASAQDAARAISDIDSSSIDQTAISAEKATQTLRRMGNEAVLTRRQIRGIVSPFGGAVIGIGGAMLAASGNDRASAALSTIGGRAMTGAMIGTMLGPGGAAIGTGIGTLIGIVEKGFNDVNDRKQRDIEHTRKMYDDSMSDYAFKLGLGDIKSSAEIDSQVDRLKRQRDIQQFTLDERLANKYISEDSSEADNRKTDIHNLDTMILQLNRLRPGLAQKETALTNADRELANWSASRGIASMTGSGEAKGMMDSLTDQIETFQKAIELKGGLISEEQMKKEKQHIADLERLYGEAAAKYAEQLGIELGNQWDIADRQFREMLGKEEYARGKEIEDRALALLNTPAGMRTDELSSKGWGSIGGSVMAGMEALTKEGIGFLKSIYENIRRISDRTALDMAVPVWQ